MKLFINTASLAVMSLFLASASQANVVCQHYDSAMNQCHFATHGQNNANCTGKFNGVDLLSVKDCAAKVAATTKMLEQRAAALKAQKAHH